MYIGFEKSAAALSIAVIASFEMLTGSEILPELTGPILAVIIIGASSGYAFAKSRGKTDLLQKVQSQDDSPHDDKQN